MHNIFYNDLNQQIVDGFLNGKSIQDLALENNLDTSYIRLVLYQEGIHYIFGDKLKFNRDYKGNHSFLS